MMRCRPPPSYGCQPRRPWQPATLLIAVTVTGVFTFAGHHDRLLLLGTLGLAVGVCVVSLPVATVLALLLLRTDVPGRGMAIALLVAMLFVPLYLQAAAWDAGFGLQGWFSLSHARPAVPPLLRGWSGAVWVHAMAAIAWSVLIIGASLRLVPAELEEQALLDASPGKTVWHVTLPRVLASIVVAALWTLVATAGEMTVTDIFQVRTFAEQLYVGFALGDQTAGGELVSAPLGILPSIAIIACLVAASLGVCAHLVPPRDTRSQGRPAPVFRLGRWRRPAGLLVLLVLVVLVGVPVGSLVYKAGILVEQTGAGRVRVWSLAKALAVTARSPWQFRDELFWSLRIAITVAVVTVAMAVPLAWLARRHSKGAAVVLCGMAMSLAVPGPVWALGLIRLLSQPDCPWLAFLYDRTLLAPCVVLTLKAMPLVTLIIWYGLRTIPTETLDAAVLDGAGPAACLLYIVLPQRMAVVAAGWLVAMALAMGDLAASILVVPPGVTTLAIRIFNLIHYGVEDRLAGLCLFTFAAFAIIAGVVLVGVGRTAFGFQSPHRSGDNEREHPKQ